jgi:polyphosphate glucokinase
MRVLVVDIGGTNVKLWSPDGSLAGKLPSSPRLTPGRMLEEVHRAIPGSAYDVVSLGYPGKVLDGKPARDPSNLGLGWVGFDFEGRFAKPLRIMNDAAMQALGAYDGGTMLFLGLGTSVGSALIVDNVVFPMELGSLPHALGKTLEHRMARKALKRLGKRRWRRAVLETLPWLHDAFLVDYIVLGGGHAKKLKCKLPPYARQGGNHNVFGGGCRLWQSRRLMTVDVFEALRVEKPFLQCPPVPTDVSAAVSG